MFVNLESGVRAQIVKALVDDGLSSAEAEAVATAKLVDGVSYFNDRVAARIATVRSAHPSWPRVEVLNEAVRLAHSDLATWATS